MALQPNGAGLSESATAGYLNAPSPQRIQNIERLEQQGFPSGQTIRPSPNQNVRPQSGVMDAFVKTCQRWHLSPQQQVDLLGFSGSEFLGKQLLEGRLIAPPQDVRDRAGYILAISLGLGSLFEDSERAELAWLKTSRDELNGISPLAYMLEGRMTNLMHVAAMVAHERGL